MNGLTTISYQSGKWYAGLDHQWAAAQKRLAQGDNDDNRIAKGGTPSWMIWNLHAGFVSRHFSTRLSLQNISNADYRTHGSGLNGMGRAIVATISFLL
jgi:outer membrane receptor protein involved in Fe transport